MKTPDNNAKTLGDRKKSNFLASIKGQVGDTPIPAGANVNVSKTLGPSASVPVIKASQIN